jgi:FkbM family methyltransferase
VFEFVNGSKMFAQSGMTGATGNLYVGLHEFAEMAFLMHFLQPDDLFADVGANVGSYTILASAAIGAHVIAFEPGDEAFVWLTRNLKLNEASHRVEARREAVGDKLGVVCFTSGLDTVNRIDADGTASVPITTLDIACSRVPALIKIDVEGSEADVLRGASNILGNPKARAVLVELNDDAAALLLEDFGFTCCNYDPFERSVTRRSDSLLGNGIFIKDIEQVSLQLRSAPAFSVQRRTI